MVTDFGKKVSSSCGQENDLISRQDAIDAIDDYLDEYSGLDEEGYHGEKWCAMAEAKMVIENLPPAQPKILACGEGELNVPDTNVGDMISRQTVLRCLIDISYNQCKTQGEADVIDTAKTMVSVMPSTQPEPLSDAYMKAVWTWLLDYQIKVAELAGRYTPYEVLSWVANDWRKEHEGSD